MDENHASTPELLRMLNRLGVCYKTPQECGIAAGTSDEVLLRIVGQKGWIFLTTDKNIRRNRLAFEAALEYKARQFVFSNNNMSGAELAEALRRAVLRLKRIVASERPPFIVTIGKSGETTLLYDCSGRVTPGRVMPC